MVWMPVSPCQISKGARIAQLAYFHVNLVVFYKLEVTVALISLGSHKSSGHNHFPVIDPLSNVLFGIKKRSYKLLVYLIVVLIVLL